MKAATVLQRFLKICDGLMRLTSIREDITHCVVANDDSIGRLVVCSFLRQFDGILKGGVRLIAGGIEHHQLVHRIIVGRFLFLLLSNLSHLEHPLGSLLHHAFTT